MRRWPQARGSIVGALLAASCGGRTEPLTFARLDGSAEVALTPAATPTADGAAPDARDASPACMDKCAAPKGGIQIGCKKRFFYGVNYAWHTFGGDFGAPTGVSSDPYTFEGELIDMRDNGADVIRWWMFPLLTATAFTYAKGAPDGITQATIDDITAALEAAESAGVHLQLCVFSFDTFKSRNVVRGNMTMKAILADETARAGLMSAVRQIAQTVAASARSDRLVSWDVINEPEWAIDAAADPYGDDPFTPNRGLTTVAFADMERLVKDTVATIRSVSPAPITVGGAAYTWAMAWSQSDLDFYTFHMYDWVNEWFPYTKPPSTWGVTGKPVVLGEFPLIGLSGVTYEQLVTTLFNLGYAGATAWAVTDPPFDWPDTKPDVKAWADAHPCITKY
jgi:hypothetical protein